MIGDAPRASAPPGLEDALPAVRSLLVIDCGSVFLKAALLGRVENRFRLLAATQTQTTIAPPVADLAAGLWVAVRQLERITGRVLLRGDQFLSPEREDGNGVDAVTLAVSAAGPLRLLLTGPGREALAGLLHRSLGGLFVRLETLPPLPAPETAEGEQVLTQVRALQPHGIIAVGSSFGPLRAQGGMAETAETLRRWLGALPQPGETLPPMSILVPGSADDAALVAGALPTTAASVQRVEALSPSTLAPLSRAVGALYEQRVLNALPGYQRLRALAGAPAMAPSASLGGMVRYLAQQYQMNVVGVDVGASSTTLAGATAQGEFLPAVHPGVGVGPGAGAVLRASGAKQILRWVAAPAEENELREYVLSRMVRRGQIPTTARELEFEYALAREAMRLALHAPGSRLAGLHPLDVVLGSGGVFAHVRHPALAALMLLDALQPRGITSIVLDSGHVAPALGSIAARAPTAAAEVAETDVVPLLLGSIISTGGVLPEGQPVLRVVLDFEDGRQRVEDILQGSIVSLPLAAGERARLSLYPAATIDVGLGAGQHARASEPVEGGALGLVVDARGRPLALPEQPAERVARLLSWRRSLGVEG